MKMFKECRKAILAIPMSKMLSYPVRKNASRSTRPTEML